MVIQITPDNIDLFEKLIPIDIATKINSTNYFFLGALHTEENYEQAVGVLVFSLERGTCIPVDMAEFSDYEREENAQSQMSAARIEWVYVDEVYRRKGHFAELIEAFYECMDEAEIDPIVCDIPDDGEHEDLILALQEWQFVFGENEIFRLETSMEEIMSSQLALNLVDSYKGYKGEETLVSLKDAKTNAFTEVLDFVEECVDRGLNLDREFCEDPTMYDMDLSLVMCGKAKNIVAALLVRKHPSGNIQPIFLNAKKGTSQNVIIALIVEFLICAKKKLKSDTPIIINCLNDITAELIDKFLPQATALQVLRGISSAEFLQD